MSSLKPYSSFYLKKKAYEHGFQFCGVSEAAYLEEESPKLEEWLKRNYHAEMGYMENHFDKRLDPRKLVPGAKTVVSLLYNYYPQKELPENDNYKIAKYAYGKDYHFVIKDKLKELMQDLRHHYGAIEGRVFVDSAPVMERQWAEKSGIGWVGKNSLLINKQQGSFFFLAELIIDLPLQPDGPIKDYCGTCTRCMDACPTDAIVDNKVVDAGRCISYATIELKDEIPEHFTNKLDDWIFGCDICQDVCPWNRFSKPHQEEHFKPHEKLHDMNKREWEEFSKELFNEVFRKSAVKRTKYSGLMRNVEKAKEE